MIRFEELRQEANLRQQDIADVLQVKRNTYSKWENCVNDIPLLISNKLVNYYQTSYDYILGLSSTKTSMKPVEIDLSLLGNRLRLVRKENNLTQTELSGKLGFPQTTYAQYETGKSIPTTLKLLTMAQFYNISFDYLIGRKENRIIE